MNFLLVYFGTIMLTFGIREVNVLDVMKHLADYGCKLDEFSLKGAKNVPIYNLNSISIKEFIPFFNIYKAIRSYIEFITDPEKQLRKLESREFTNEMLNFEKHEYLKKQNIFNLLKVLHDGKKRVNNALYLDTFGEDKNINGEVFYEIDPKTQEITILSTFGIFDTMLASEIKEIIMEHGAKEVPKRSFKERFKEQSKIIIRCVNLRKFKDLKGVLLNLTKREKEDDYMDIIINVNESETGLSQIVVRPTSKVDVEVIEVLGGILDLTKEDRENSLRDIVKGYIRARYNFEIRNVSMNYEHKTLNKSKEC